MAGVRPCHRGDSGSAAVETVICVPALAALLVFVVVVGRVGIAKGDLAAAAQHAARAISIARDSSAAVDSARDDARQALRVGSPTCRTWDFDAAVTATDVTIIVSCDVDLSEAAFLPVPGSVRLRSTATEVIDRFRESSGEFGMSEAPDGSNPSVGVPG
jgi:Flp pilus assembly protein TadG